MMLCHDCGIHTLAFPTRMTCPLCGFDQFDCVDPVVPRLELEVTVMERRDG